MTLPPAAAPTHAEPRPREQTSDRLVTLLAVTSNEIINFLASLPQAQRSDLPSGFVAFSRDLARHRHADLTAIDQWVAAVGGGHLEDPRPPLSGRVQWRAERTIRYWAFPESALATPVR